MIADPNEHFEPEKTPEEPAPEKLTWPKTFDQCPNCGSKVRLGATAIKQLKDEGKLHKDSFNGGLMHQIPLVDQAHRPSILGPVVKLPVIFVYWDVCECGTMYANRFDMVEAPAQVQMQRGQQPPNMRGFPGNPGRRN